MRFWLLPFLVLAAAPVHAAAPRALAVSVKGALPGIADADVTRVLAQAMTAAHVPGWTFTPGASTAPDRVTWTITPLPFAGDTTRRIGRLMSKAKDLFGRYRYVSVEVRVFLDGQYQTTSFATGEIQGGAGDPKLADLVASVTVPMLTIGLDPQRAP